MPINLPFSGFFLCTPNATIFSISSPIIFFIGRDYVMQGPYHMRASSVLVFFLLPSTYPFVRFSTPASPHLFCYSSSSDTSCRPALNSSEKMQTSPHFPLELRLYPRPWKWRLQYGVMQHFPYIFKRPGVWRKWRLSHNQQREDIEARFTL